MEVIWSRWGHLFLHFTFQNESKIIQRRKLDENSAKIRRKFGPTQVRKKKKQKIFFTNVMLENFFEIFLKTTSKMTLENDIERRFCSEWTDFYLNFRQNRKVSFFFARNFFFSLETKKNDVKCRFRKFFNDFKQKYVHKNGKISFILNWKNWILTFFASKFWRF